MIRRSLVMTLASVLVVGSLFPASASTDKKASKKELDKHAVDFVETHPEVLSDPAALDAYTRERMALYGLQVEPSVGSEGDVGILCGSFCTQITNVYSISVNSKVVDDLAFPIWEATVWADYGSGGASGTWSATWSKSTSSTWNITASITGEASALFFTKISGTVGGGYSRTTATSWSGTTSMNYSIPAGTKQTLYAYEKGTYWTFNCDCEVAYSGGHSRMTVTSAAGGREAYPYQATTFRKGPVQSL
jgi:hypothetical protein